MKYKTILFDIDDTLLDFKKDQKFAFYKAMEAIGIICTDELYSDYCDINTKMWKLLNDGEITLEEVLINRFIVFLRKHQIDEEPKRFKELVSIGFQESGNPIVRSKGTLRTIRW